MRLPCVIVLSGPAAVGKNAIAARVCQLWPEKVANVDLDTVKEFVYGAPKTDFFLDLASAIGRSMVRIYLSAKMSVVVHKAFCSYLFARPFIDVAGELGATCGYFKLYAPLDLLLERNRKRGFRSTEQEVRDIYRLDQARAHPEGTIIDTARYSVDESATFIIKKMEKISRSFSTSA